LEKKNKHNIFCKNTGVGGGGREEKGRKRQKKRGV